MIATRISRTSALRAFVVILFAPLFVSCAFIHGHQGICDAFDSMTITPLTFTNITPVQGVNNPGTIMALHGTGLAKSDNGDIIKVEQSVPIPTWANRGAVFLNGWELGYGRDDHHVYTLATLIGKIRTNFDPTTKEITLIWNALGWLTDTGGAGFTWQYDFTVLFWADSNLNAEADQGIVAANGDYCSAENLTDNYYIADNNRTGTALSSFVSFIQTAFATSGMITVLPRGFAFLWNDNSDHHLLQLAYNLNHSDMSVTSNDKYNKQGGLVSAPVPIPQSAPNAPAPTGASLVGSGFVRWSSYAIFKDNDERRDYSFGEMVSAMAGNDVGVVQPPFSILPVNPASSACNSHGPGATSEEFVIENVPFEYAIPLLTGWDLKYQCEDHHVKEIGIRIVDWNYEPPTGGAGGTLHYRLDSAMHDNSNATGIHSHKVTVLGFRPLTGLSIGRH